MKITEVEIENIKGIQRVSFKPGIITFLRGRNGSGKTSVLHALSAIFEGGSNPGWLRNGEDKGFVRIALDNGYVITKSIRRSKKNGEIKCDLEIVGPDGVEIPAPQTFIRRLSEPDAVDPSKILRLDSSTASGRKALVELLLDILPIHFSFAELSPVAGEYVTGDDGLDLAGMDKLRAQITEERRVVGSRERDSYGMINTLRKTLVDQEETDWSAELTRLQNAGETLARDEANELVDIRNEAKQASAEKLAEFQQRETNLRDEFQAAMAALNTERSDYSRAVDAAETAAIEDVRKRNYPKRQELTAAIATAKERAIAQTKAQGTREAINAQEVKRKALVAKQDSLTAVLKALDDLKKQKLDSLPVDGVTFAEDQVLIAGIPWQHVNLARRVEVSLQLASLRSGDLNLLLLDDSEHLDSEVRRMLEEGITEAGFQLIEATVKDHGGLTIETVGSRDEVTA